MRKGVHGLTVSNKEHVQNHTECSCTQIMPSTSVCASLQSPFPLLASVGTFILFLSALLKIPLSSSFGDVLDVPFLKMVWLNGIGYPLDQFRTAVLAMPLLPSSRFWGWVVALWRNNHGDVGEVLSRSQNLGVLSTLFQLQIQSTALQRHCEESHPSQT